MGFDVSYQGLPDNRLIDLARDDVEDGWGLSLIPGWFHYSDVGQGPSAPNRIWDAAQSLAAEHPAMRGINCRLDRQWDVLHYLLSATRRGEPGTASDHIADRAFNGGDPIAAHVCGGQGVPVLHIPASSVRAVADLLAPMTPFELMAHYDAPRMESSAVYKFWADREPADALPDFTRQCFAGFRDFFIACATHGYAAIRCKD